MTNKSLLTHYTIITIMNNYNFNKILKTFYNENRITEYAVKIQLANRSRKE